MRLYSHVIILNNSAGGTYKKPAKDNAMIAVCNLATCHREGRRFFYLSGIQQGSKAESVYILIFRMIYCSL